MGLSRVKRLSASIFLSLVMVAGSGAMALAADPSAGPSDAPVATATPTPSVDPTPVVTTPTPTDTAAPSESPSVDVTPAVALSAPHAVTMPKLPKGECAPWGLPGAKGQPDCAIAGAKAAAVKEKVTKPAPTARTKSGLRTSQPVPAATTADSHSVQGTVTGDGDLPVANVHVHLASSWDKEPGYLCFGCYSSYDAVTDSNGHYSIDGVDGGEWLVLFLGDSQGYLDGYYSTTGQFTTTLSDAQTLDLSGDQTGVSVKLGKQYFIQGTLTAQDGGAFAAGVSVIAWTGDMADYSAVAITQSDGSYSVPVVKGNYYLLFMDLTGVYLNGCYDTSSLHNFSLDTAAAVELDATSGSLTGKDAQLPVGWYVSGKVFDTAGQPLAGVEVTAYEDYDTYRGVTTSQADGSYSLDVPKGLSYWLEFAQQTQVPWDYGCYLHGASGNYSEWCDDSTDVAMTSNLPNINVTMDTGYYISGKVTQSGAGAVEGISVYLSGDSYDEIDTASDGSYEFSVADPGSYMLQFFDWSGAHLNGWYDEAGTGNFSTNWQDATSFGVSTDFNADVTLASGDLISGTVTGSGSPLAGAYVEADSAADYGQTYIGVAYAGDDGTYSIVVPDGAYRVYFSDFTHVYVSCWYVPASYAFGFDDATDVTVPPDALGIDVDMPIGHDITGTVTSPDAGNPGLEGIYVIADGLGVEEFAVTDSDGSYDLTVPAGTYTISFSDPSGEFLNGFYDQLDGHGFTLDYSLATALPVSSDTGGINAQLMRGNQIHGRATNLDGTPIPNFEIDANSSDYSGWTRTDDNGNYSISVLSGPAEAYTISTWAPFFDHVNGYYCANTPSCVNHFTTVGADATPVTVNGVDVLGINMSIPGDPGAPRNVAAIAADGSALVSWTAPLTNGGFAITDYTVVDEVDYNTCDAGTALFCNFSGLDNQTSYTFIVYATNTFGEGPDSDSSDPVTTHALSTFHPVTPIRLVDSRIGVGLSTKLTAGVPQSFDVIDTMGLPHAITAVTANVTIVQPSAASSVYLGPDALAHPKTATISFNKNDITAYGSTIAVGEDGTISATYMAASGTTNLVVDVTGYFTPDATGDTYHPLTPARILDTRSKNGLSGKFVANKPRTFTVRGRGGVPAGAIAVTGNLTVTDTTSNWAVYLGPVAYVKPPTSTINFAKGQTRANSLTVILSPTGTLSATYLAGANKTIDIVFDVTGYYTADLTGASYQPITANSLLDTRTGNGLTGKFSAGVPRTFPVWNRGDVPATATGVTGIIGVVNQSGSWAIFIGPIPTAKPTTSALNFVKGDNCSNGFTQPLSGTGTLSPTFLGSKGATTNVVVIVTGYFEPAP